MNTHENKLRMMAALQQLNVATEREYTIECADGLYELRMPGGGSYSQVDAKAMEVRLNNLTRAAQGRTK